MSCLRSPNSTHVGRLIRELREVAGLLRTQLAQEAGLSAVALRNVELERYEVTPAMLRRLLKHPSMQTLSELARCEGITLPLEPGSDKNDNENKETP